jgi:hypothetical protein
MSFTRSNKLCFTWRLNVMHEIMTLRGKIGLGEPKIQETWYLKLCTINKHKDISVSIYWNDVSVLG